MSVRARTKLVKAARKPGRAGTALTGITRFPVGGLEVMISFFENFSSKEQLQLNMEKLPVIPFTAVVKPGTGINLVGKTAEKLPAFCPNGLGEDFFFKTNRICTDDKKKPLSAFADIFSKAYHNLFFRCECADGECRQFMISKRYVTGTGGQL